MERSENPTTVFRRIQGTLAILLPSPASHEGTLAILRFQEDLGDLGTKYDGGLHARPPRFRGTQGTLAILGPRGHSSGPIRKQSKFPDFKVRRSSGAIFWTEFDCILEDSLSLTNVLIGVRVSLLVLFNISTSSKK